MADSNFVVKNGLTVGNVVISATNNTVDFGSATFTLNANPTFNDTLYVNLGTANAEAFETSASLTNAIAVMEGNANAFVQFALHNIDSGGSASSDFIAYMDGGDNTSGFIDMGITSSGFNDPAFGSTNAGDGYLFMSAGANLGVGGNLVLATDSTGTHNDIVFAAGGFFSGTEQGRFKTGDGLEVQGNVSAVNGAFYQGADAKTLVVANGAFPGSAALTNVSGVFTGNANGFVQFALNNANNGVGASTDLIVYADNGDNDSGWMDMGITSSTFNDITYGVTGPNDGYIFMSAPTGTSGNGSMYISTSGNGAHNDIVFSTGGFAAGTEKMRIIGDSRVGKPAGVEIYIPTTSTSTGTGALRVDGGIGVVGNINVGGDVNVVGNVTFGGNAFTLSTASLDVTNPIIYTANGNPGNTYDQGIVAQYVSSGTKYSGMVKDASDQHWKFFDGLTTKPTTEVNFSDPSIVYNKILAGEYVAANTTASTSTTTGAFKSNGGAGIAGNIFCGGNITSTGNVLPSANATYSIGATGARWANVWGLASSAQYADLAEYYHADATYEPGTVLDFGGANEVTICGSQMSTRIAGVVSTAPGYIMNDGALRDDPHGAAIALQGRVPTKVVGPVAKGDMMVSAGNGHAMACSSPVIGSVIGKALENFGGTEGVIEVVIGRV
jgi:hypothetical protein